MYRIPVYGKEKYLICVPPILVGVGTILLPASPLLTSVFYVIGVLLAITWIFITIKNRVVIEDITEYNNIVLKEIKIECDVEFKVGEDRFEDIQNRITEVLNDIFSPDEISYVKYSNAVEDTVRVAKSNARLASVANADRAKVLNDKNEVYYQQLTELYEKLKSVRDTNLDENKDIADMLNDLIKTTDLYKKEV